VIRLVATDLDGTVVRRDGTMSERTVAALAAVERAGLHLVLVTGRPQYFLYGLLCGYGFAWIGHFVFEKNKPASFKRPLYSFMGDWVMYRDVWLGRVKI